MGSARGGGPETPAPGGGDDHKRRSPVAEPARPKESPGEAAGAADGDDRTADRPSRTEARNAAARDRLVPLGEGERPRAVTVGAIVAAVFAVGNVAAFFAGADIGGERQSFLPVAVLAVLLLVTAWGMWRARYWAVLGMQALLGITLLTVGLFVLLRATPVQALIFAAVILVPGGALFWFLIKAMARIQMPSRR